MKQVILINLLLWIFLFPALSQQGNYLSPRTERGYVYFKDGTVLKGKYLYSPDLSRIRVTTKDESRVYDAAEVEKVSHEKPKAYQNSSFVYTPRKFTSITEGGILFGNSENYNKAPFVLSTSVNYTFWDGLSAGIGTGLESYRGTYLPVTANIHYRFGTNRVSPFATIQAGYLIALESNYSRPRLYYSEYSSYYPGYDYGYGELDARGGFMINPAIGGIIETDYGFGVSLSVGYRYHRLAYKGEQNEYRLHADYNRLSLKLGIIF